MIGESGGIKRMNGIEVKEAYEQEFTTWTKSSPGLEEKYGDLLPTLKETYDKITPLWVAYDYYREAGLAIELVSFAGRFAKLVELSKEDEVAMESLEEEKEKLKKRTASFFKDYYQPIDEEVMESLLKIYSSKIGDEFAPDFFGLVDSKFGGDWRKFTEYVFDKTIFDKQEDLDGFIEGYKPKQYKKLEKDPAYQMYSDLAVLFDERIKPELSVLNARLDSLQQIYMAAQMEMQPEHRFYPDANFTLRVTYGNVKGYKPYDAVDYRYYTSLEGIMEKEDPNIYDYVVEDRLKELYQKKDYGPYAAKDGSLRVAFVATNHTTGGNSGSPVLNGDGHLVGVNFDRCWEGTMSDLMYDPQVCRNISIDIRYFLFIVDKFAGAGYLLDEMKIMK
jgi:hypothetical protein